MKYRVLTTGGETQDAYMDCFQFCAKIAGEWETDWWTQVVNDNWTPEQEQHCWYFNDKDVAMLFKVFSGGRSLKEISLH